MLMYNKQRSCRKCDSEGASTEYIPPSHIEGRLVSEYMLRKCCRCGYEWREHTLDTLPPVS